MAKGISIWNYREHIRSGKALYQWQKIYRYLLREGKPKTRRELSEALVIPVTSMCGRLDELMSNGLVKEAGVIECRWTKKPCTTYKVIFRDDALKWLGDDNGLA